MIVTQAALFPGEKSPGLIEAAAMPPTTATG